MSFSIWFQDRWQDISEHIKPAYTTTFMKTWLEVHGMTNNQTKDKFLCVWTWTAAQDEDTSGISC